MAIEGRTRLEQVRPNDMGDRRQKGASRFCLEQDHTRGTGMGNVGEEGTVCARASGRVLGAVRDGVQWVSNASTETLRDAPECPSTPSAPLDGAGEARNARSPRVWGYFVDVAKWH